MDILIISPQKQCYWYSLEAHWPGASNELMLKGQFDHGLYCLSFCYHSLNEFVQILELVQKVQRFLG